MTNPPGAPPTLSCPCCGGNDFCQTMKPLEHSGAPAFVRISVLSEQQAKRGDVVLGGDNGFIARAAKCDACGFVALFHAGDAPRGSGGAGIFLGGGASVRSGP